MVKNTLSDIVIAPISTSKKHNLISVRFLGLTTSKSCLMSHVKVLNFSGMGSKIYSNIPCESILNLKKFYHSEGFFFSVAPLLLCLNTACWVTLARQYIFRLYEVLNIVIKHSRLITSLFQTQCSNVSVGKMSPSAQSKWCKLLLVSLQHAWIEVDRNMEVWCDRSLSRDSDMTE